MTDRTLTGAPPHPAAAVYVRDPKAGKPSRREPLARTRALGVTASGACAFAALASPAATEAHMRQGGTLRMQNRVFAMKDPRTFDVTGFASSASGWLEYLVEDNDDGGFAPHLPESREVNDESTRYTLDLSRDETWNDGTPFAAEDVTFRITRWCDSAAEGNSLAGRFAVLMGEVTGTALDGAIEVVGAHAVVLNLPAPDTTPIAGMADDPAAIVPQDFNPETMLETRKGTGPSLAETREVGVKSALGRDEDHDWWGYAASKGAVLDRIEYIDCGTDPIRWFSAAESAEIVAIYATMGDHFDVFDSIGWTTSDVVSGATMVIRPNQLAEVDGMRPYEDIRVRRAIVKAVRNSVCLELGHAGRGVVAENHRVPPVHPEYAEVPRLSYDPEGAYALLEEAGMSDYEFELTSIDDDRRRNTTDAVAAQLRDAGFNIRRTVLPSSTFWNDRTNLPFSSTNWNHRPLGTQIFGLAHRTDEVWNVFGFSSDRSDIPLAEAKSTPETDTRREGMAEPQQIRVGEGVTIRPCRRSPCRHSRPGVANVDAHIADLPRINEWGLAA